MTFPSALLPRSLAAAIFAAVLVVTPPPTAAQSQWEPDIRAFEEADRSNPPPSGAVLFVGSSSIRMWSSLESDFEGTTVIHRGFGGSQMDDLIHFMHRIVVPYAPRQIVVYEGDNDVAAGKSTEQVFADYRRFVALVRNRLPDVRITFIAIKPSLARWETAPEMRRANELIRAFAAGRDHLDFVDVWEPMLGPDSTPMADLFLDDGLHMNAKGYGIWTAAIAPYLMTE